jgi:hypothetical protein
MGKGLVPVPISAASAQMAARHLLNRKTGLLANFRCGSIASFGRRPTISGLPPETDIVRVGRHVSKVPRPESISPLAFAAG